MRILIAVLLALCSWGQGVYKVRRAPGSASVPNAFVQHLGHGSGTFPSATFTITLAAAPSSGNTVFVAFGGNIAPSSVSSTNTTWTLDGSADNTVKVRVFRGVVAGGAGGTSVSVTYDTTGSEFNWTSAEFSGVLTSSPLDGSVVTSTGSSTTPTTGAYTPGSTGDLYLAATAYSAAYDSSDPSGYTSLTPPSSSGSYNVGLAYVIGGSYSAAQWTLYGSSNWATAIGGYKHQ